MRWPRRVRESEVEWAVEPFSSWRITTTLPDGSAWDLSGHVYMTDGLDYATALRYVDAVADGLRAAGFSAEVTLTRERKEAR